MWYGIYNNIPSVNKKVLLRERKRHTARHILDGGTPGYLPPPGPGMGYPPVSWMGTPPPGPGMGYPPKCKQRDTCQNSTFPHTSYAGGNDGASNFYHPHPKDDGRLYFQSVHTCGGGVPQFPISGLGRGYPIPGPGRGVPHPRSR